MYITVPVLILFLFAALIAGFTRTGSINRLLEPRTKTDRERGNTAAKPLDIPADSKGVVSGPVREPLPWDQDERFKALRTKYETPYLMAAYRASLPDPILFERHNIDRAAHLVSGVVVQPGQIFSQNQTAGPYSTIRGFKPGPSYSGSRILPAIGGGVCKIASLLYNVAIQSNVEIVERHPHSMTVPYVPPGQDATVTYGINDFKFRNTTKGPMMIWADSVGDTVYMAFYGQEIPPKVTWHHEQSNHSSAWTEVRYNHSLAPGIRKVAMEGHDGLTVHTWLTIETSEGKKNRRDLGKSYYRAGPRVVEVNPNKEFD